MSSSRKKRVLQFLRRLAGINIQKIKPPTCNGDPRDYASFKHDFKRIIGASGQPQEEQLYTLVNKCVSAKDKKLLRTADTLEEAWNTLDKMYGKKHDIVSLVKEIMDLKLNNKDRQSSNVILINLSIVEGRLPFQVKVNCQCS